MVERPVVFPWESETCLGVPRLLGFFVAIPCIGDSASEPCEAHQRAG